MANADNTTNLSAQPAPATDRERHTASTGRRRLFGLAAGTAAALTAPTAIAAIAGAVAPVIQENPELLQIGRQLPALLENYRVAVARRSEAKALFQRTRPALPQELIWSHEDRHAGGLHRAERGIDGAEVYLGEVCVHGGRYSRSIYQWKLVQSEIILHEVSRRTKEGKQLHKIARLAKRYEHETAAAVRASGFEDRDQEMASASVQIDKLAGKLHQQPELKPRTAKGLLVYADAILAVEECLVRNETRSRFHVAKLAIIVAGTLTDIEVGEARDSHAEPDWQA